MNIKNALTNFSPRMAIKGFLPCLVRNSCASSTNCAWLLNQLKRQVWQFRLGKFTISKRWLQSNNSGCFTVKYFPLSFLTRAGVMFGGFPSLSSCSGGIVGTSCVG